MSLAIVDDSQKVRPVDPSEARTLPRMTKYELDSLLGLRAMHLSKGAVPFVDLPSNFRIESNMQWRSVAIAELRADRLPYMIKRSLPNGKIEYWRVGDLDLTAVEHLLEQDAPIGE